VNESEAKKLIKGLSREEKLLLTELLLELRKNRQKNNGAAVNCTATDRGIPRYARNDGSL
jgi:hypothetical protein